MWITITFHDAGILINNFDISKIYTSLLSYILY